MLAPAIPAVETSATAVADEDDLGKEAEQRFAKRSRMVMHGISTHGGDTPRVAVITAIKAQH